MDSALPHVTLRDMTPDDLTALFEYHCDPEAIHMAAFTAKDPTDRAAFMEHFMRVLGNSANFNQTVLVDGQIAGYVAKFELFGEPTVGYWFGRDFWGRGIATAALAAFVQHIAERPLYARVAKDNAASLRMLQKCGFTITGEDKGYAEARGMEIEEWILTLHT